MLHACCAQTRDFETVTIAASCGFIVVFWSILGIAFAIVNRINDNALKKQVAKLRAQGKVVALKDLKKKKARKNQKAELAKAIESGGGYGDLEEDMDESDWIDEAEDKMSDAEEVMRRRWQWKVLDFLYGIPMLILMLTVVFVDLIVAVCAEVLDPSDGQNRQVILFGYVCIAFFFAEIFLRMWTFAYVHGSMIKFFKDFLNCVDFLVVFMDVAVLIIMFFLLSYAEDYDSNAENRAEFTKYIRVVRILRLARLGRVARAVRVVTKIMGDMKEIADEAPDEEEATPDELADIMANRAVDMIEQLIMEDGIERARRLEQHSWYHFSRSDRKAIEVVYNMFTVGEELHRMDLYAALRRFGCKINISQARFLIQEFDVDGSGTFSLKQFARICARAQVVAKFEPKGFNAPDLSGVDKQHVPPAHRGLSMIEVRALVDVFDEMDERKIKPRKNRDHVLFSDFPGDGLIDKQQLVVAIKNGGYNPTLTEIQEYMETYDPTGSGWITKQDFLIIMGRVPTSQGTFTTKQYAKIVQLFEMYDVDNTGLISFVELKALMWRLDLNFRKGAAALIIDRLFPTGLNTPLDKQTVVSILSHAKARREQYVRGGVGVPDDFSPVLDGAEVGEDLSRVPKVPPGVLTLSDRAIVMETFEYFDSSGSGTVPRFLFKKCLRMLGFYQIESAALDAVARKIPPHRDGRMDFPEFFALIGFVMMNAKRGMYGELVGTVLETPPDEPESIEDVLTIVCEPAFLAQFTSDRGADESVISLPLALPAIAKYVDEMVPSASCLYEWMDGVVRQGHEFVPLERFVETIHDVGEQYYAEFDARARKFHSEQLFRWVGEAETRRASAAFSLYTDKSSILARTALEPLLVDLGYPVTSHEGSKDVLREFMHPKDKSAVLFPELLYCLKTLAVVRLKAEDGHGDFTVDKRGIVSAASGDGGEESVNPLHDSNAVGVDAETTKGAATAKKKPKEAQAPAGGYMLVARNLAKKKIKVKVKAKDELDEEGYVKPKSAYELFVLTNPTADQVDLLNQWNNLMTDMEKNTFEREANDMRKAYDDLRGGVVDKAAANEHLKRKKTGASALSKKDEQARKVMALEGISSLAEAAISDFVAEVEADRSVASGSEARSVASKGDVDDTRSVASEARTELSVMSAASGVSTTRRGLGKPLAAVQELGHGAVENHIKHTQNLAIAPPPRAPESDKMTSMRHKSASTEGVALKHFTATIIVPPGLSSTGVPAELTAKADALSEARVTSGSSTHIAANMPHITGPITAFAPPPPPASGSRHAAPAMPLSLPVARQFADASSGFGGSMGLPPPPPVSANFRR